MNAVNPAAMARRPSNMAISTRAADEHGDWALDKGEAG